MNLVKKFNLLILFLMLNSAVNATTLDDAAALDDDNEFNYNYSSLNERCPPYDPYEKLNRKFYYFNAALDTFILRPVAKIYIRFTNDFIKNRVGSFVENIETPLYMVQYGLQANGKGTLKSFSRFVINSTLGIGGLFDVASKFNLNVEPQTFGNTLAYYGVGPGPYVVLPIFGGTNARDFTDSLFTNNAFNPLKYYLPSNFKKGVTGAKLIHNRSKIMPFTDYVAENSTDSYIAIRDASWQAREAKMGYPKGFVCPH